MNPLSLSDNADRHLARMLQLQARDNGDTPFLISDESNYTFAEADDITARIATGLSKMGIERGDRICLLMSNVPELVIMCLAANKLGAIWVPICTDYKGDWLRDAIARSEAKAVVVDQTHLERFQDIRDGLPEHEVILLDGSAPFPTLSFSEVSDNEPMAFNHEEHHYGDTCAILWTSGTTGRSKGVMQAHNNWVRATLLGAGVQYTLKPGDVAYCAMPLYNSGAWLTCIIRALISGIGCAIEKKFSVSQFMPRIKHFGATQTFAVGAMGVFLMNSPEQADDASTPLREAGIAPMPPELWNAFEQRFAVKLNRAGLGMSECLMSLNQEHTDVELPTYCLGFAPPDMEVELFDDEGNKVPDGTPGEICVRPLEPYLLFNGYFGDPEATQNSYRGDWFLTGDMGRRDPETRAFYFVDRKKDCVRFAGRNISTLEVENVVRRHPAIADVAAFGIPSELIESEDELKLNIVLEDGETLSAETLCQYINDNAPHYFVPRYIEFVDALPYTPTNKVQKYVLRQAGVSADCWDLKQSDFSVTK